GAFLQAYALKRHPAVLLNLGLSELRSNHIDDAGNHLEQYLREHTAATPDQKASAEKGLAEAKKRGAYLVISVDAQGADVSVDGTLVGKAPVVDPVFVKPGKHTVLATFQGKSATGTVDAKVGIAAAATLTLGTSGTAPTPTPTPSGSTAPAHPPPPSPAGPAAAPLSPSMAQSNTAGGPQPGGPAPDQGTSERQPFFKWYVSHPLNWVLAGVTVVGLGAGLGF